MGSKIVDYQHGFRPRRGVHTNMAEFNQYLSEQLGKGAQVDVVYTDFQKTFDKVNHVRLLRKLKTLGFSSETIDFFQSYLTGRRQYVLYGGMKSHVFQCPSGVGQGSDLGPLLFSLFINDIGDPVERSKLLLYADDLKMYRTIECVTDCEGLQDDLNKLVEWSEKNRLPLNVDKCETITYTRKTINVIEYTYRVKDVQLEKRGWVKDLGIKMDEGITYKLQTSEVRSKAKRLMGFLIRNPRNFKNVDTFLTLYFTLVRSNLEYGALIWNPIAATVSNKIEAIQKRFLRFLYNKIFGYYPNDIQYEELLEGFGMLSLSKRRTIT